MTIHLSKVTSLTDTNSPTIGGLTTRVGYLGPAIERDVRGEKIRLVVAGEFIPADNFYEIF